MLLVPVTTKAFVNHGEWKADCARTDCANAFTLEPRQQRVYCTTYGGCGYVSDVDWPDYADEISEALAQRPVPATRNWAPAGHRQAFTDGFPDGQTVSELRAETADRLTEGGA